MKIISLGLDNSILNEKSDLADRAREYGELVDQYVVFVPFEKNKEIIISDKARAYGSGGKGKISQFLKIYKKAKIFLLKNKFDIVTVQDQYFIGFLGYLIAKKFQLGFEIQVHGWEKFFGIRKMLAKFILPRANSIRAVSQRIKKQLMQEFGIKENKITAVPIYTDTEQFPDIRLEKPNKFVFLTVGRLVPVKNIEMQIEAMADLVKEIKNVELWVVGDGSEAGELKLKIKDLKLENYINLLGWKSREELKQLYKQANCFLLTSDAEGWGMAVVEAACFGLPIIMTDVGLAEEVIINGESGIVIEVDDKKALLNAMKSIIQNEELRSKLAAGARKALKSLPSKKQTINLYKESWQKAMI